ncbi:MAG: 30S ribosomal protein S20 [Patescibacteria group bacterium]|jgi:small subunit ribosomal protein S20
MPNLANAKKALRQSVRRATRNATKLSELHSLRRQFRLLTSAKKLDEAKKMIPEIYKKADKAVTQGILKKNSAARIKSRMQSLLNK